MCSRIGKKRILPSQLTRGRYVIASERVNPRGTPYIIQRARNKIKRIILLVCVYLYTRYIYARRPDRELLKQRRDRQF